MTLHQMLHRGNKSVSESQANQSQSHEDMHSCLCGFWLYDRSSIKTSFGPLLCVNALTALCHATLPYLNNPFQITHPICFIVCLFSTTNMFLLLINSQELFHNYLAVIISSCLNVRNFRSSVFRAAFNEYFHHRLICQLFS